MKYVIDIQFLKNRPANYMNTESWPGRGIYLVERDEEGKLLGWIYLIDRYSVEYFFSSEMLTSTLYIEPEQAITESLLLKAIAAAARPELLIKEKQA